MALASTHAGYFRIQNIGHLRLVCLSVMAIAMGVSQAKAAMDPAPTLNNPGFEGTYKRMKPSTGTQDPRGILRTDVSGDVAEGWTDNSGWASTTIRYERETDNPHSGKSSQRMTIERVDDAAQFVQPVRITELGVYRFSIWLRGQVNTVVKLELRKAGGPYTLYAAQPAGLSGEWRKFDVVSLLPADTEVFLMLRSHGAMSFVMDDASFERLPDPTPADDAKNIVNGGSFEADAMPYGWSAPIHLPRDHAPADPKPVIDRTTAADGKQSLRFDLPAGASGWVMSPLLSVRPDRPYTVSVSLKASKRDTPVRIQLERALPIETVHVGTEWKRYVLKGTPAFTTLCWMNIGIPEGDRSVWIDGMQVIAGDDAPSEYRAPYPVELTLKLHDHTGGIVLGDDTADVFVAAGPVVPEHAKIKLLMIDVYGHAHELPDIALPAKSFALPISKERPFGTYKLHGAVVDPAGKELSAPAEMIWSRIPRPREISADQSFFGLHFPLTPGWIQAARNMGVRWERLISVSDATEWQVVEPKQGEWHWYDSGIDLAHHNGIAILGMLQTVPQWATTNPRNRTGFWAGWNVPDKPGAMDAWGAYVGKVVKHYKGRISHWSVWNEPWGNFLVDAGGTAADFARLQMIAYEQAKKASPDSVIVGVDASRTQPKWDPDVLKHSGTNTYHIFQYHDYTSSLYGGPLPFAMRLANHFNASQQAVGAPKPLWMSEGGPYEIGSFYAPRTGGLSAREQLAYAVRFNVTEMAAGVRVSFLYAAFAAPRMGLIEWQATECDGAIKPILAARAALASLVDGAGRPIRSEPVKGIDAYAFPPRDGQTVTVLWSYTGQPQMVAIPQGAKVLDVMGNPLPVNRNKVQVTSEPIYFVQ